jgi:C4-dicarboxylate-specific signal transduction histidine kinase
MKTTIPHNISEPPPPIFLPRGEIEQISCGLLHDLINPLTGLTLFLETALPRRFHDIIGSVTSTSNSIRDFVRIIRDAMEHSDNVEKIIISQVTEHVIKLLSHKARQYNVTIMIAQDTHNATVYARKIKIYQILLNLVSNGIDAFAKITRNSNRIITISISQYHQHISIVVADNASGIPDRILKKIFRTAYTNKSHGAGVGLIHTHTIVKGLGGTIHVSTTPDVGTKFYVSIPCAFKE